MPGTYDYTGLYPLKQGSHVKIRHPKHSCAGMSGTIVRVQHPRVWVALPDGRVVPAGHRSVEVIRGGHRSRTR